VVRSKQRDDRCQFVDSSFTLGDVVELRSLFLSGRSGDDVQLSESDVSPESGLERFSLPCFRGRSSVDADVGDGVALGVRQNHGSAQVSGRGICDRGATHSRSAYLRFRF